MLIYVQMINILKLKIDHVIARVNCLIQIFYFIVVPGYKYIQYGRQSEPSDLWPSYQWRDISTQYSGLFFRAMDNRSEEFGLIQNQSYTHLSEVSFGGHFDSDSRVMNEISLEDNNWSPYLRSGSYGGVWTGILFNKTDHEVRPRKQAIRIWQRI